MDMGGSLLLKTEGRPRTPDFSLKYHNFYIRPYCREFLDAVLDPAFGIDFAFYTSREVHNAEPQINLLGSHVVIPNLKRRLFYVYAGKEFEVPDPLEKFPDGAPKMMRSLPRIWAHKATCARAGVQYDECSTLNIDSTERKVQDHLENSIVIPSYEEADVTSRKDDKTLLHLRDYLAQLKADSWGGDIREYLRMHPFSLDGRGPPRIMLKGQALAAHTPAPQLQPPGYGGHSQPRAGRGRGRGGRRGYSREHYSVNDLGDGMGNLTF